MIVDANMAAELLPEVPADANKYSRGSVLVVGGSARYTGAPLLAALASARAGAGYTSAMVPRCMELAARAHLLSIPVMCPDASDSQQLEPGPAIDAISQMSHLDCIVLGPGMGASPSTARLCELVLERVGATVVADADALNCISGLHLPHGPECNSVMEVLRAREGRCILTPHDGELGRLAKAAGIVDTGIDRREVAARLSAELGCVVVAKGSITHVLEGDDCRTYSGGTPALAKAGMGDVLAGMVGAFAAMGLAPRDASSLAVFAHGLAGNLAAQKLGVLSVMAEDVLDFIPAALSQLECARQSSTDNAMGNRAG